MREVHYFEAQDGTRFDEREDCEKYEHKYDFKLHHDGFDLWMWDKKGERCSSLEDAFFIKVKSQDAIDWLMEESNEEQWSYPYCISLKDNFWYYDDNTDEWCDANELIRLAVMLENLE